MAPTRPRSAAPSGRMLLMLMSALLAAGLILAPLQSIKAAAPDGEAAASLAGYVVCHVDAVEPGSTDQAPGKQPSHSHDCQLCPACHLATHAALAAKDAAFGSATEASAVATAALRPPATGPPGTLSLATPPTGPPPASV